MDKNKSDSDVSKIVYKRLGNGFNIVGMAT